jgi:hypothetical protein
MIIPMLLITGGEGAAILPAFPHVVADRHNLFQTIYYCMSYIFTAKAIVVVKIERAATRPSGDNVLNYSVPY